MKCNQKNWEEFSQLLKNLLSEILTQKNLFPDEKLSKREITCLVLAAAGKTSKESADFLKLTRGTVETYRKGILRKLNCQNIAQAVYKGIWYGYIQVRE